MPSKKKELTQLAFIDDLTNLYNRRYLFRCLEDEMRTFRRFSILYLDLDHFKNVNDVFGHLRGDKVLKELAEVLKSKVRGMDKVFRFAGDEFIILLPQTGKREAIRIGTRIIKDIENTTFAGEQPIRLTASIGVASFPQDTKDLTELLNLADRGVYVSKKQGGDRVSLPYEMLYPTELRDIKCSKLIARERELALLNIEYQDLEDRESKMCIISGEAGIGKTRLLEEFLKQMSLQEIPIYRERCYEVTESIPYAPWKGIIESIGEELLLKSVASLPLVYQIELGKLYPQIVDKLNIPFNGIIDIVQDEMRLYDAFIGLLKNIQADRKKIILFIDDLHWSDVSSYRLMEYLLRNMEGLFLLGTYRKEEIPGKSELQRLKRNLLRDGLVFEISLERLGPEEVGWMIQNTLQGKAPESLAKYVFSITEGIPLFVEELIKRLIEMGHLFLSEKRWIFKKPEQVSIPPSVKELLTRRVIRLRDDIREILRWAATFGREFNSLFLAQAMNRDEAEILDSIGVALREGLLLETQKREDTFWFHHELAREILYQELSRYEKKKIHAKIAEALEKGSKESAQKMVDELSEHYFEAGIKDKAYHYSMLAGRRALQSYAYDQATFFFTRAIQISRSGKRKEALLERARSYSKIGKLKLALRDGGSAYDFFKKRKDFNNIVPSASLISSIHQRMGNPKDALAITMETLTLLPRSIDPQLRAELLMRLGQIESQRSNYEKALNRFREARKIYERGANPYNISSVLTSIGTLYLSQGKMRLAQSYISKALELAKKNRLTERIAINLLNISAIQIYGGLYKKAKRSLEEAIDIMEYTANRWGKTTSLINLGVLYGLMGKYEEAGKTFEDALSLAKFLRYRSGTIVVYMNLAGYAVLKGENKEALRYVEDALEISEDLENKSRISASLALKGEILTNLGELREAYRVTQEAVSIARNISSVRDEINALISRGVFYRMLKLYKLSIEDLKLALEKTRKIKSKLDELQVLKELVHTYLDIERYRDAKVYSNRFDKAHNKSFENRLDSIYIKALYLYGQGQFLESKLYVEKLIKKTKEAGFNFLRLKGVLLVASIESREGNLQKAKKLLNEVVLYAKKMKLPFLELGAYYVLIQVYREEGDSLRVKNIKNKIKKIKTRLTSGLDRELKLELVSCK